MTTPANTATKPNTPCGAIPVERGCGTRVQGGIYLECGLSPDGLPIENFLCDPPIRIPAGLRLSARGIGVFEELRPDGTIVTHAMDVVGRNHYPNVADFVEEVRRFGTSRRIQSNFPFDRLSADSQLVLIHHKAWINNGHLLDGWTCPKHHPDHIPGTYNSCCAGQWWSDLEPLNANSNNLDIIRTMPSFTYHGKTHPPTLPNDHQLAIFLRLPISRIVVIDGQNHDISKRKAQKAGLPICTEIE